MSSIIKYYKNKRRRDKINAYVIEDIEDNSVTSYKDRVNYVFQLPYKRKYHFGEVFNRILCLEKNKPKPNEIEIIKTKLNGDLTRQNIYKNLTYNQRKHLNYIYFTLNNIFIENLNELQKLRSILLGCLIHFYSTVGTRKGYKYQLVLDVICEQFNYIEFRNLLYFKDNVNKREYVKNILFKI